MTETTEKLELPESGSIETIEMPIETIEKPKADYTKFTKRKSKKKKIIIIAGVVAIVGIAVVIMMNNQGAAMPLPSIVLVKQELSNKVNITGTVESSDGARVYSSVGSTINAVNVQVGDYVNEGDVLAQLDTTDLELSIAQQQASMSQTAKVNEFGLSLSEKEYQAAAQDLSNDMNSGIVSAEQRLKSAQRSLNDARLDLNEHKDDLDHADEVMNALEKKLSRARDAFATAEKALKKAEQEQTNNGTPIPPNVVEDYNRTEKAYNETLAEWNTNNTEYGGELSIYSKSYRQARLEYESALANRDIAEKEAKRRLDSLQDSIKQNEIGGDLTSQQLALKKLQKQKEEATMTAPISGTVTAVYAKVGAPGTGLLFVVENTDELVIKTKIKEYDVTTVKEGMPALIKSDATGEKEFEGEVKRIYPAAIKSADGSTQSSGSVEFETEVALLSEDSGLRVGMNVRLNVVTAKKDSVFAVPFESVTTDEQGNQIIFVARANAEGKMIAETIPVTTGMETDFYIEIQSDALADGDTVLTNPMGVVAGSEVVLMPQNNAAGLAGK